jgi:hypothetical protein
VVGEAMRVTSEAIAEADGQWLAGLLTPAWAARYGQPIGNQRLSDGGIAALEYVLQVGAEGMTLQRADDHPGSPPTFRALSNVDVLRQVWIQQYWYDQTDQLRWRQAKTTIARRSRRTGYPGACGHASPASAGAG